VISDFRCEVEESYNLLGYYPLTHVFPKRR